MLVNKGSELAVESLVDVGVDTLFSIISIHNMELQDALRAKKDQINNIGGRTETGLGFMADGFARATGQPGVYITSAGPGAMYSMPSMGEAYFGCSPVLQITTNVAREFISERKLVTHQTSNQLDTFKTLSGYAARVDQVDQIPDEIYRAFAWLKNNRPRPSVLEIPFDLFGEITNRSKQTWVEKLDFLDVDKDVWEERFDDIVDLLSHSKRPLFWLGEELHYHLDSDELFSLVETHQIPVVTGEGAKGVFPEEHPLSLGPAVGGRNWGENPLIDFINRCDLVIVIGACLPYRSTVDLGIKMPENLIHISQDRSLFDRNYKAKVKLKSRGDRFIKGLVSRLQNQSLSIEKNYTQEIKQLKIEIYQSVKQAWPNALRTYEALRELLPENTISCWDITIPMFGAVRGFQAKAPRSFFYAHGWFGLGFGLPASIGAKIGCPDKTVVCFSGDGGFQYTMQELGTAVQHGIHPIVIVFNDSAWGLLKRYQENRYAGRYYGTSLQNPDFQKLAGAYGIKSFRAKTLRELCSALEESLNNGQISLIEVNIPDGIESFR